MRIYKLAAIAGIATIMASCSSGKKTNDASDDETIATAYTVETVTCKDSVVIGKSKAVAECTIAYLKSDDADNALVKNVDKWIHHMLMDAADSIAVGEPLASFIVNDLISSNQQDISEWEESFGKDSEFPMAYDFTYTVKPEVITPGYVTMMANSYIYTGGAHGGAATIGCTFATATGEELDFDNMFDAEAAEAVTELVKKGLMEQYFKVETEEDFKNSLLFGDEPLPLPANAPFFMEEGVCFLYQQYEIACYAAGMPQCVIPYKDLRPYFTKAALAVLEN